MTIVNDAGDSPEIIMDVRRRPILIEARYEKPYNSIALFSLVYR